MQTIIDIFRRSLYICIFVIPIPIGAYTIHNGSSAMVALISYLILGLCMPSFYLASSKSGFGIHKRRIYPILYWLTFLLMQGMALVLFSHLDLTFIWNLPTVGRDFLFGILMYGQVTLALVVAYLFNIILGRVSSCTA